MLRLFLPPSEYGKVLLCTFFAHVEADRLPRALSLTISCHLSHSIRRGLTSDLAIDTTALHSLSSISAISFTRPHETLTNFRFPMGYRFPPGVLHVSHPHSPQDVKYP
jgi:hypothetical protein